MKSNKGRTAILAILPALNFDTNLIEPEIFSLILLIYTIKTAEDVEKLGSERLLRENINFIFSFDYLTIVLVVRFVVQ